MYFQNYISQIKNSTGKTWLGSVQFIHVQEHVGWHINQNIKTQNHGNDNGILDPSDTDYTRCIK